MSAQPTNGYRRLGPHRPLSNSGRRARLAVTSTIKAGARAYDRQRDLPGLIRLDPFAAVADDVDGISRIVARLERALRAERCRARSGHWTYDLNRHIALRQAFLAESERLAGVRPGRIAQAAPT